MAWATLTYFHVSPKRAPNLVIFPEIFKNEKHFGFSCYSVKSHFKALGLYNFIRGFGWAYKWGKGGGALNWDFKVGS